MMITEFKEEYNWLSNFVPCNITFEGKRYASVEHAYMSAKSKDKAWKKTCADPSISAGKIKKMSREITLVENWTDIKLEVMYSCLIQKFSQEPFKTWLLETGDRLIQEGNTWGDTFWGVDLETGIGENNLGVLIMNIREKIKHG